jgi:prolipoprotein diacylglyceryltransferase
VCVALLGVVFKDGKAMDGTVDIELTKVRTILYETMLNYMVYVNIYFIYKYIH